MAEAVRGPLADYHRSQGATLAEYHGAVVPARFSDPVAEHRAVRKASGILDFSFRAKLTLSGEDRVRFLNGMVTNDVKDQHPRRDDENTCNRAHHERSDRRHRVAARRDANQTRKRPIEGHRNIGVLEPDPACDYRREGTTCGGKVRDEGHSREGSAVHRSR